MNRRLAILKTVLWALVGVLAAVTVVRFTHGLGAVTHLSDAAPWGLWIGFDVMSGVALAAGGFVLAATVYVFGLERYRPFVRPAILTAWLGYAAVAVGLLFDLGLPWRIWHPAVHWQVHSVLFEVAACVMLYLTVLSLEFAPVILEHPRFSGRTFRAVLSTLKKLTLPLVITGIVLSTLHQSSLGSLFLITPFRLHPLWYSGIVYVLFFVSAVALGLMMVVLESLLSGWFLGHRPHRRELGGLGIAASVVLWVYLALRLGDLALRGTLGTALDGSGLAALFLVELAVSAAIPATLLLFRRVRSSLAGLGLCASLTVGGMILYRLDVAVIAFARPEGIGYVPSWAEVAVSLGIVAAFALVFLFFAERLRVYDDAGTNRPTPPRRRHEPSSAGGFLPPTLAAPRRHSLAAIAGASLALLLLPLTGARPVRTPVSAPRAVEGTVREREEGSVRELGFAARARAPGADGDGALLLAIDGDRDGDLVLFDHDTHLERTDGSCEACHHMSLPLDRHSGCSACHRDMHEPTELFDHTLHQDVLGGNDGCSSCHVDAAVVKSRETSTACGECHGDDVGRSPVIQDPDEAWRPPVGYQEAMHGLCVTCHELAVEDAPGLRPPTLATCTTCHDADRAERLEGLRPSPPAADGRRSAGARPSGRAAGGGE